MDWNGYSDHLNNLMIKMLTTTEYSDVTLVCDDSDFQFKTHKSILSACSPELEKMIRKTTEKNPVIYLRGIHSREMEALIQFMYQGRTTISQKDLPALLKVAQDLKIKGIGDKETEVGKHSAKKTDDEVMIIDKSATGKEKNESDVTRTKHVISQQHKTMMVKNTLEENVMFGNENKNMGSDFKRTITNAMTKVNEDYDSSFDFSFEQLFPKSISSSPNKKRVGSENVDVKEEKVLPVKRGRGRPKKGDNVIKEMKSIPENSSIRRGRGRPRKVDNFIKDKAVVGRKKDVVVNDPLAEEISPGEFNITV